MVCRANYDPGMDPVGSVIHRVVGRLSPSLKAALLWRRAIAAGDFAMRVVDALVLPGDLVLDIGAASGLYANRLARLVGRLGEVHAFEPNPVYRRQLYAAAERLPQLHVHTIALSDEEGEAELNVPEIGSRLIHDMGTLVPPSDRPWEVGIRQRVPLARLDNVIPGLRPAFVKCDVEGHELAVLEGGRTVLGHRPPILMEIEQRHHDRPITEVFTYIKAMGYVVFPVRPQGVVPLSDFDVTSDQMEHLNKPSAKSGEPPEYVKDFLLFPEGSSLPRALARAVADRLE